ncbi:mitochondrial inner membrane protease-like protein ATP23 [Delitschia confertaspora ATCC 74209]|uniref:Mitochondrial inner membrane protease ATP23 n=1 Tax=Delitschia confertaspora ATCC 74209 TaxID=1513339 RepID=A0A9P4MMN1_9PLEO|nr:mitochondrial inner membrane protease-like protein ATP23 [Delitschia confertaspora ATCC 74209]
MPSTESSTDGASVLRTTAPAPSNTPNPPPIYYTWSNLFSILAGNASDKTMRGYLEERDTVMEESDCKRCEKHRDFLLQYSPIVHFMKGEIAKQGGELNSKNIICRRCPTDQTGGFTLQHGILLCANKLRDRSSVEDTLAHEMIHAWDYLKWKVDDNNLRHQACLEIRASTLSGECRFTREFFTRKQFKITEQLQSCVRRRATLSMLARPGVKDDVHAAKIVNEVWDSCFSDPRPFDEIYR